MSWTSPRTWVALEKVTAALLNTHLRDNLNFIDGRTLGYAEVTADQTGISTITDLTGLSVTVTVGTNRLIRITGQAQLALTASGTELISVVGTVRESTTVLGRWGSYISSHSGARSQLVHGSVVLDSPGAGSHTYKLSLERGTGAGTVGIDQAADNPAFILVEDIGGA